MPVSDNLEPLHAESIFNIQQYRPRIEGSFARIERWTNKETGETHWRSISKENVTTIYGKTKESRISEPADKPTDESRIFSWLVCESYDDKGNATLYRYEVENSDNVDTSQLHEKNRNLLAFSANRYLKRILYGNRTPRLPGEDLFKRKDWLFEVVFDYDEGHYETLPVDTHQRQFVRPFKNKMRNWSGRQDAFSSYRAGFEVRTIRLCRKVLMFHHFPNELKTEDYLVRSTEFSYEESPIASFISGVIQSGYTQTDDNMYLKKSLPPLEFEYSKPPDIEKGDEIEIKAIDRENLENIPYGLDDTNYRWVDMDGEGISGILTEQANAWFYKPNLGQGNFGPLQVIELKPFFGGLGSRYQQLMDLSGDGQLDLVEFSSPVAGFFERTLDQQWKNYIPFRASPNIAWDDPNLKFVDLTGDGHADIIIFENESLIYYPSMAEEGFGPSVKVSKPHDEEHGPSLVFADGTQSIYLADMSGDGLTDLVRICNGEVCYWPNLGYGLFGAKVTMDNSPWFDYPDEFNQQRVRLADIDGSGITDIIYFGKNGIYIYFNQSGNSWSRPRKLPYYPNFDDLTAVNVVDFLGNGTACLVWSSPLPDNAGRQMKYIDLMAGRKPHLLVSFKNNMGAETQMHYVSSTKFYLEDRSRGQPWITRLPFPVHVVEKVEVFDRISKNYFVTSYTYHHGYFDGAEREFRGFGMVEKLDTEEFASLSNSEVFPSATNLDKASYIPPVLVKTWFHTGAYFEDEAISRQFKREYYTEEDPGADSTGLNEERLKGILLEDTVMPEAISAGEALEACRALKGSVLRQEIYALDGTEEGDRPYSVSESNYTIKCLQSRGNNKHAVFFIHARETIDYHYERKLFKTVGNELASSIASPSDVKVTADPRISHSLTLAVDDYGNVLESVAIGYGRRFKDPSLPLQDQDNQAKALITFTENRYTGVVFEDEAYRTPLPCETRTYEVSNVEPSSSSAGVIAMFKFDKIEELTQANDFSQGNWDIPYENVQHTQVTEKHAYRRLIEHVRILYRSNQLDRLLPLGTAHSLALPGESYKLAFTQQMVTDLYDSRVTDSMLETEGAYVHGEEDSNWWIPSGRIFYSPNSADTPDQELDYASQNFYLPHRYRDSFHTDAVKTETFVSYDIYNVLIQETRDSLGNVMTVGEHDINGDLDPDKPGNDYRVLQPKLVMDPNRNRIAVAFDSLGMVVGTAVMGKPGNSSASGDRLEEAFQPDLTQTELDQFFADPKGPIAALLLDKATTRIIYDLRGYLQNPDLQKIPPFAATLARETHFSDPAALDGIKIQISFSYSDGFGREIQKKIQAEPGIVPRRDPETGRIITDANNHPEMTSNKVSPRWVGSGWVIFNNKGKPVRQYEPFFTDTHSFEFDTRIGVSPVLFYDPLERGIITLHPNHTWEKIIYYPWHQETWDVNDTVKIDPRNDTEISGYIFEYFKQIAPNPADWKTWLQQQGIDPLAQLQDTPGLEPEKKAAVRTLIHADTPTIAYFDSLGRTFLTLAHNRSKRSTDDSAEVLEEKYKTRVVLDIEGNQREVIDAKLDQAAQKGRIIMRYDYNMLSSSVHESSMDAEDRWTLNDVTGKPIRAWDSKGHKFRNVYDSLRRPTRTYLRENAGQEMLVGYTVYGETHADSEEKNLREKVYKIFDQTGIVTSVEYDFKGNLLQSNRQLAKDYKNTMDWPTTVPSDMLEDEIFTSTTTYDALNRPTQIRTPHSNREGTKFNIIQQVYNEANLLEREDIWLEQAAEPDGLLDPTTATQHTVKDIDYNAKGQRELIDYGNGVSTTYEYDPFTFRLTHMETLRGTEQLQDLFYTYDPAGNVIKIRDDAQQTIYFNGQVVRPDAEYWYDAIYRLIETAGREHIGQASQPHTIWKDEFRTKLAHPNDEQAMRNYFEFYEYDEVGNILLLDHKASNGNWIRTYEYNEESQIEAGKKNNRLSRTVVSPNGQQPIPESYTYDKHGNMTSMPHVSEMAWDFKDELHMVDKGGGCKVYYVYDASGQRMRKVVEQNGKRKKERIYLGGFEIYREYNGNETAKLERETLHIMDEKQRIALVETRTKGEDPVPERLIRYQLGNHLGSVSLELDDQAKIISYEEYYPYGSTSYQAVRSQIETPKRYRYTGKERDEETGFYYHGARYYAPWLGRWINCDPRVFREIEHPYAFVVNNPIKFIDPDGADEKQPSVGTYTMPPNRGDLGTLIHDVVLKTFQLRLAVLGVSSAVEVATLPDGSKNMTSTRSGRVDLALLLPDAKKPGAVQAQLYELKPRNPEKYQDYVSEVDHYTEHFPKTIDQTPVSQAKIGTGLNVAEKAAPQLFDPITISNNSLEMTIHIDLARDNNNAPIPGVIVYDVGIRQKRPGEENNVERVKQMLKTSINQTADAQAHGIVRTSVMVGGTINTLNAFSQILILGGGLVLAVLGLKTGAAVGTGTAVTGAEAGAGSAATTGIATTGVRVATGVRIAEGVGQTTRVRVATELVEEIVEESAEVLKRMQIPR